MFVLVFAVSLWATLRVVRYVRSQNRHKPDVEARKEIDRLRERAEENVHNAQQMARRTQRLQYLMEVQGRKR